MAYSNQDRSSSAARRATVFLILGVIIGLLSPRLLAQIGIATSAACNRNVQQINQAIERWHFEKGTWPDAGLSDIGTDPRYFPEGLPRCPVNGCPYLTDPATHRVVPHDHANQGGRRRW